MGMKFLFECSLYSFQCHMYEYIYTYAVSLRFLATTLGIILLTRTQGSVKNIEAENTRQGQDVLIEDR
jgi:hypothetical protein